MLLGRRGAGEVPVFVFCVSVRGAGFVFTRVFPVAYDFFGVPGWPLMPYLMSRSGRFPPKLRASCAPADPGPRPAATPARPPPLPLAPWRLGLGSASCIAIGLSRRPPRAGLADVARPHCAMASIGIMSGSNSQIEYPQGPIRDQYPASLTNTRARQPPEPQACAGSAFC